MTRHIKQRIHGNYAINLSLTKQDDGAYIRQESQNGKNMWVIYDGQGEKMGHANSREMAFAVAYQNDFAPVDAH